MWFICAVGITVDDDDEKDDEFGSGGCDKMIKGMNFICLNRLGQWMVCLVLLDKGL